MKPHPPNSLLGPGQVWVVTQAQGWSLVSGQSCNYRPEGNHGGQCRQPATIAYYHDRAAWYEYLCEQHMGTHRWINEGVVQQWRATPPWNYRNPTKVTYKRKKVNDAE